MSDMYAAKVSDVPDKGIRLIPTPDATVPELPNEVNLLGMAVALALGAASYEHHPAPRDPEVQTLDALLAGEAVMPWRPEAAVAGDGEPYVVCERTENGAYRCVVEYRA
ncbi:hypothetical protein OG552_15665 [Streptomyces sp. NBC_01476]|uniref:hypothetical protein n=1 Tax=Streptomyces sp. NBC_01476 TaxID=2903881 RepID=UPI002E2F62C7|nr:hypothetical protein [Streptomyces sp. NBC_01476]